MIIIAISTPIRKPIINFFIFRHLKITIDDYILMVFKTILFQVFGKM